MKKYRTDWLNSKPVFYNTKTKKISHNISEVISFKNVKFHPEGLNNYLDFGYSVFGQTPIKNVKFLGPSSSIEIKNNKLKINEKSDPVKKWLEKNKTKTNEKELLKNIKKKINKWERNTRGKIILPLSGGYDSRLLATFLSNKERVHTFTYGVSNNQKYSYEVINAKKIARKENIKWNQIHLGYFHKYIPDWLSMYGPSTHAHGMYHIEFYKKIVNKIGRGHSLLSGIFGDVWAGGVNYKKLNSPGNLTKLGYTHGICANKDYCKLKTKYGIRKKFWETHKKELRNPMYQIVHIIRLKMILVSSLLRVPIKMGFNVWSPFLDKDIALSMLNLPKERRKNRVWQKDFFKEKNLNIDKKLLTNTSNTLNYQVLKKVKLKPLDKNLLKDIIEEGYVGWINSQITKDGFFAKFLARILTLPKIGGGLRKIGINDPKIKAYYAYLTIKPLEYTLTKSAKKK